MNENENEKLEDLCDVLHEAGVCIVKFGELFEVDESVAVGVDLSHHTLDLFGGGGAEVA